MYKIKFFNHKDLKNKSLESCKTSFCISNDNTTGLENLNIGSVVKVAINGHETKGTVVYIRKIRGKSYPSKEYNFIHVYKKIDKDLINKFKKMFNYDKLLKVSGYHLDENNKIKFQDSSKWTFRADDNTKWFNRIHIDSEILVDTAKGKSKLLVNKVSLPIRAVVIKKLLDKKPVLNVLSK